MTMRDSLDNGKCPKFNSASVWQFVKLVKANSFHCSRMQMLEDEIKQGINHWPKFKGLMSDVLHASKMQLIQIYCIATS